MKTSHGLTLTVAVVLALTFTLKQPANALLPAHLDYDGCNTCHNLHGGPALFGGLLNDVNREASCLGCHGPLGIATEAAVHNPNGRDPDSIDYVTCLECHNPHDNRTNVLGGTNIKLVGIEFDYNADPPDQFSITKIREEIDQTLGSVKDVVFEVREGTSTDFHRTSDLRGPCAICHTFQTSRHGSAFLDRETCTRCHSHANGFLR